MELLEFIFQDIWHFLGIVLLLTLVTNSIISIIHAIKNKKDVKPTSKKRDTKNES